MKRPARTLLLIALCFIVVGAALAVTATAVIRTRNLRWEGGFDTYPAQEMSRGWDGIENIEMNLVNEPVTIVRGGDEVTVEWSQTYDDQYVVRREDGTLVVSREPYGFGWERRNWYLNVSFATDWLFRDGGRDLGGGGPVTVTIPEGIDLRDVEINGANMNVTINRVTARDIEVNGANAILEFFCPDRNDYEFETNGLGSSLIIDGESYGAGIGQASYGHSDRSVTVNGANAVLEVTTDK